MSEVRVSIRPDCEGTRCTITTAAAATAATTTTTTTTTCGARRAFWGRFYSRLVFYGRFMNAALPFEQGINPSTLAGENWT